LLRHVNETYFTQVWSSEMMASDSHVVIEGKFLPEAKTYQLHREANDRKSELEFRVVHVVSSDVSGGLLGYFPKSGHIKYGNVPSEDNRRLQFEIDAQMVIDRSLVEDKHKAEAARYPDEFRFKVS